MQKSNPDTIPDYHGIVVANFPAAVDIEQPKDCFRLMMAPIGPYYFITPHSQLLAIGRNSVITCVRNAETLHSAFRQCLINLDNANLGHDDDSFPIVGK